jgi:hypothetical protein
VGEGRCWATEHKGPEAAHDGDLCAEKQGISVTRGPAGDVPKDGDAQVIASKGRSKWYVRDGLHPDASGASST